MVNRFQKGFIPFIFTQAFGAFNDNFFKMLLQLHLLVVLALSNAEEHIATAGLLFTIPFVIFGPWSGYLADRFAKSQIITIVKFAEILIMMLGFAAFTINSVSLLMFVLFLMASHSAFFSPSKAGFIPETCPPSLISKANGLLGMSTFVAIIFGTALAGVVLTVFKNNSAYTALVCIGCASMGFLMSRFVTPTKAKGAHERFPLNPITGIVKDLVFLKKQKGLFLAALANSYFWLIGLMFQTNILVYGTKHLGLTEGDNVYLSALPAFMGIGIAAGSMLAARWSGKLVEIGLVPLGGFGLSLAALLLGLFHSSYVFVAVTLTFSGIFGGLYIIPLNAFLQTESEEHEKGRVISTAGVMNGLALVMASLLYRLFAVELHLQPAQIFTVMSIITFFVTVYIFTVIPQYLLRFMGWLLTHSIYKITIINEEHVPANGAALLVPNHVTFIDAFLVGATVQRFIRFIMYKKYFDLPVIRNLCNIMGVIPIAPYEGRESVTQSLADAKSRLQDNEIVCIFAEGGITRDGNLQPFRPGLETIMQNESAPIIPVYMHNLWGSIFSFEGGKALWKWPKKLRYPVTIIYGKPMPSGSKAAEVEAAIKELQTKFVAKM